MKHRTVGRPATNGMESVHVPAVAPVPLPVRADPAPHQDPPEEALAHPHDQAPAEPPAPPPTRVSADRGRISNVAVVSAAVGLIGASLCVEAARSAPLPRIGDTGLAGVLGWHFWLGLVLIQCAFLAALYTRRPPTWLLTLLTSGLVISVYGAAAFANPLIRGEVAWRHLGIIDHLVRSGRIDTGIDAYFSWPGFFALFAPFAEATGLPLTQVALWAPVWNNALWLLALGVLVSQLTTDRRHVWLTVWIFASVNWIDQDYFSPQAFAFLLYLVIFVLVLRLLRVYSPVPIWRRLRAVRARVPGRVRPANPRVGAPDRARPATGRVPAILLVLALSTAMIASHQLTPFALVVSLSAMVLLGLVSAPRLPLVIMLVLAVWLLVPAAAYLAGHPVAANLGDLATVADRNLTNRITGSPDRLLIVRVRMLVAAAVWGLAAVGLFRRWRAGHRDTACVALAVAPFVLLPLQSYGGEMLLRVTLYSLPFMCYLAAAALLPRTGGRAAGRARRALGAALAAVLCLGLCGASIGARYGNARFDMFTSAEVAGVNTLYQNARPGDVLIAGAHPTPWRHRDYATHRYLTLQDICEAPGLTAQGCFEQIRDAIGRSPSHRGLVLLTRSNREALRMQNKLPADVLGGVEQRLTAGPEGRLLQQTPEVRIYEVRVNWKRP